MRARRGRRKLIEQALLFAIGFVTALLAAVVALPVISRRAMRLAEARARLQAPATEKQAAAERDALRAQYAVQYVRLERRAALAEESSTALRADLGKHSVSIATLESTKADRDAEIFDLRGQIERLRAEGNDLEVALAASQIEIHDAFAQRDRAAAAEAGAMERAAELEAEVNRDRAKIAILTARGENFEGRIEDASRSAKAARQRAEKAQAEMKESLEAMTANVRRLEERLREAQAQKEILAERMSRRDSGHEDDRRRIADLESRLAFGERAREETLLENGRQLATLADREAALRNALANVASLEARLSALEAGANVDKAPVSPPVEALEEESRESLRAAHAERDNLRREIEVLGKSAALASAADDAALRASVARLGRDVARLFSARRKLPQIGERGVSARQPDDDAGGADEERRGFAEPEGLAPSHAPE